LLLATEALGTAGDPYMRMLVELEQTLEMAPMDAAALCDRVRTAALNIEYFGVALKADLFSVRFVLKQGETNAAAARWSELQATLVSVQAADMYLPDVWSIGHEVLTAQGDAAGAAALLARSVEWIEQTALRHVPATYRDSFLHRNPVNRRLLTAASRAGNALDRAQ
jgi:hypothetical protein